MYGIKVIIIVGRKCVFYIIITLIIFVIVFSINKTNLFVFFIFYCYIISKKELNVERDLDICFIEIYFIVTLFYYTLPTILSSLLYYEGENHIVFNHIESVSVIFWTVKPEDLNLGSLNIH